MFPLYSRARYNLLCLHGGNANFLIFKIGCSNACPLENRILCENFTLWDCILMQYRVCKKQLQGFHQLVNKQNRLESTVNGPFYMQKIKLSFYRICLFWQKRTILGPQKNNIRRPCRRARVSFRCRLRCALFKLFVVVQSCYVFNN